MTKRMCRRLRSGSYLIRVLFLLFILSLVLFCFFRIPTKASESSSEEWCGMHMARGNDTRGLGPVDFNAGYSGFLAPVRKGQKLVMRAQFPHSRYMSLMVYDQKFMPIDAIRDYNIVPSAGVNPFVPGTDRSGKYLGEFEIQVLMEKAPEGNRPPNTLYAGIANDGDLNKMMVLAYRVYLPDKGFGYRDNHPEAVFGGVESPRLHIVKADGETYCPSIIWRRLHGWKIIAAILKANKEKLKDPTLFLGEPKSPPIWMNNASRDSRRENTYIPNDDTDYIAAAVSGKLCGLLVLRWYAARTPEETYIGAPFPENADMRYWSLSFAYYDKGRWEKVLSEKTVADIDVPALPDGSRQIVIGFGSIERPKAVPPEQWVSLKLKDYFIIMRNIIVNPNYAGNFGKLPIGEIPLEYDRFTPGGVYCSVEEFLKNPDIALTRMELLKKSR